MSHQLSERWNSTELVRGERTPLVAQSKPGVLQKTEDEASGEIQKLATSSPPVGTSVLDHASFTGPTYTIQGIQAENVHISIKNYQGSTTAAEQQVITAEPKREVVREYRQVFLVAAPRQEPSSFVMPWNFIGFMTMVVLGFVIVSFVVLAAYRTFSAPTVVPVREQAIPRTFYDSLR